MDPGVCTDWSLSGNRSNYSYTGAMEWQVIGRDFVFQ